MKLVPNPGDGIVAAVVTMMFRRFGGYEQTVMFAVLLMNALAPVIDRLSESILRILRRVHLEPRKRRNARAPRRPQEKKAAQV